MKDILMNSRSPTQERTPIEKTIAKLYDTEICNMHGDVFPCTLSYIIINKEVVDCSIEIHGESDFIVFGGIYSFSDEDEIRGSVRIMVEDAEGAVEWKCKILIQ
jgi:hypothetical protein